MSAGKKKYNRNQPEGIRAITMFCMIVFVCVSFYEVYFWSMGVYLFRLKPMLIVTLILAFIPAMAAQAINVRVFTIASAFILLYDVPIDVDT